MELKDFNFPKVTGLDMAFSTIKTDKDLLAMAKEKGFYCGHTPYNRLFNDLFFSGGKIKFKPDVDQSLKEAAWPYCRAFMMSFEPRQEEKEGICAMIMAELLEPELDKN